MIVLETDRLIIRESSGRDFSRIYSMMLSESGKQENSTAGNAGGYDEPGERPCKGVRTVRDEVSRDEDEELEKYLAYIHTVYPVFGFGLWTVCLKEDPSCIIGRCGLQPIADDNSPLGRIELGYLIDERWRGQGYASEACTAIVQYAFEKLEIEEIYAQIPAENKPSERLARRLGFDRKTGGLWVMKNPAWT